MSYRSTPRGRRSVQPKQFISAETGDSYHKQTNQQVYQPPTQQQYQQTQNTSNFKAQQNNKQQQQQQQQQQLQQEPVEEQQEQNEEENIGEQVTESAEDYNDGGANPFKGNDDELNESGLVDENGKVKFKKIFATRRKASVRAKEKRIRQNRRLRKTIVPKNALMALNELKGVSVGDFIINNNPNGGFIAMVTINSSEYEGRGASKTAAKNNACEKALRDYILAKMRERPRKLLMNGSNGNLNTNGSGGEVMDTSEGSGIDETSDVPMVNLASFAIYKLFSEWESEGFIIPEMHPALAGNVSDNESTTGAVIKEPKKPVVRNDLPQNWEAMHPASLLCFMRPGVSYVDKGCTGEPPNTVVHSLGITVDGEDFEASGRSKKLARRNVAAIACNALFNTNFDLEAPPAPV